MPRSEKKKATRKLCLFALSCHKRIEKLGHSKQKIKIIGKVISSCETTELKKMEATI